MTVTVRPIAPNDRDSVLALRVLPEQIAFAGQMPELLRIAEAEPENEAMCVDADGRIVGFYRLDFREGAIYGRDFGAPSVGLRGFFIDAAHQGRGLGVAAIEAMIADLCARHPSLELLALSVSFRNAAALRAYEKAGFAIVGEPYLGGAWPQHVMVRQL